MNDSNHMDDIRTRPTLKFLHSAEQRFQSKLDLFRRLATRALVDSLRLGLPGSLKTRPDGTILDGHHRIVVLRERKFDVDALPREVLEKQSPQQNGNP